MLFVLKGMESLWAPWRAEYVRQGAGSGECILCSALTASDDRARLVLTREPLAFVLLNAYPYAAGHLMVAVTRHVGLYEALADDELAAFGRLTQRGILALTAALRPDGFNLGINQGGVAGAGVEGHLHMHIVPRWNGDTNFMPVIGGVRVISQDPGAAFEALFPHFG